jgi:hypothetical protein
VQRGKYLYAIGGTSSTDGTKGAAATNPSGTPLATIERAEILDPAVRRSSATRLRALQAERYRRARTTTGSRRFWMRLIRRPRAKRFRATRLRPRSLRKEACSSVGRPPRWAPLPAIVCTERRLRIASPERRFS